MILSSRVILSSGALALGALLALPAPVQSASLQASPVLVEMTDKAPSAVVTIRNTGDKPIAVQTRVMQWSQARGQETLQEAEAVIASPPMTTLKPGANYAVRIVRTAKGALGGEEAYRVLVDQLPDASPARGSMVALVMRHSIPVFLSGGQGGAARVDWELGARNGRLVLRATNHGSRRLRLAQVTVQLGDGRKVSFGNGLLGYVLAGSTMEWVSVAPAATRPGGMVMATTDLGPLSAQAHALR
jgi:fimbrial chaperone protein